MKNGMQQHFASNSNIFLQCQFLMLKHVAAWCSVPCSYSCFLKEVPFCHIATWNKDKNGGPSFGWNLWKTCLFVCIWVYLLLQGQIPINPVVVKCHQKNLMCYDPLSTIYLIIHTNSVLVLHGAIFLKKESNFKINLYFEPEVLESQQCGGRKFHQSIYSTLSCGFQGKEMFRGHLPLPASV